jgi:hypothetical protein
LCRAHGSQITTGGIMVQEGILESSCRLTTTRDQADYATTIAASNVQYFLQDHP